MGSIVLCEKADVGKLVRRVVGQSYGEVHSVSGHFIELVEPHVIKPEWKTWTQGILWPGHLYPKDVKPTLKPYQKESLREIGKALKTCNHVILAMDPDREGDLIGGEVLEHFQYRGKVSRVMFVGHDDKSVKSAFENMVPFKTRLGYYNAAKVREQADKIINLSLTRTFSTLYVKSGANSIGVGRVRTPTLAILCRREEEIANFEPQTYHHVTTTATVAAGSVKLTCSKLPEDLVKQALQALEDEVEAHDLETEGEVDEAFAPSETLVDRITDRALAERLVDAIEGASAPIERKTQRKETAPPRLYSLTELSGEANAKLGWDPSKVLEVTQKLYEVHKVVTYPRTNSRYLPENYIPTADGILDGLVALGPYADFADLIGSPRIRKGAKGHYSDAQMKEANHHAIIPNPNTADAFSEILPNLSPDEAALFDIIARSWLAAHAPNYVFDKTDLMAKVSFDGHEWRFVAGGSTPVSLGWRKILKPKADNDSAADLPQIAEGEYASLDKGVVVDAQTKPPARYSYKALSSAMKDCWRLVDDPDSRRVLKNCDGIGTEATRAKILETLKKQGQITEKGKHVVPTQTGMTVYSLLKASAPNTVDPIRTAYWEMLYDQVIAGDFSVEDAVVKLIKGANREIKNIIAHRDTSISLGEPRKPGEKLKSVVSLVAKRKGIDVPRGTLSSVDACRKFLDEHGEKRVQNEDGSFQPTERQTALLKDLLERTGERIGDDAWTNAALCKQAIDKLMKNPKAQKPAKPPSEKQIAYAKRIAEENDLDLPKGYDGDWRICSKFIEKNMKSKGSNGKTGSASGKGRKPTEKQVSYLRRLADDAGEDIPDEAFTDAQACSQLIDKLKNA